VPVTKLEAPALPSWLDLGVPFERYRVDLGAWRMHVMEHGHGPTVLMLHGNPTWGYLWRRVVASLGASYRVVVPDLIGLGLSDKPHTSCSHTLEAHIGWVGALIDRLDLRGITFVGQDWGGPIGLGALAARPDRVHGLVLANTVFAPPREGFKATAFHRFARMPVVSDVVFRGIGFPQIDLGVVQGDPKSMRGPVGRAYRWPLRQFRDRKAPLALARMVPDGLQHPSVVPLRRVDSFVRAFDGPIEGVWGDRDPILGSIGRYMERTLPHATVTHTQAGHFLQEEVPDVVAEAIARVVAAPRPRPAAS
jgi:pimeloyl-ACP methyl ester carboxylesterase